MEFNVINEKNMFKIGNLITIFKLPNHEEDFALFSVSDFEGDESDLHVAYILKDNEGYDYISEIEDKSILKEATLAVEDIVKEIG